eukprot:c20728_g1_i13.p3 GENE.c20728_g1_i13~~c20728_g1_i13.p3  ORF type:complete len:119 (+),score=29.19 c20728_g1_i13:338-694(+)
MLDDSGKEEKLMKTMKKKLRTILNMDEVFTPEQIEELAAPTKAPALVEAMLAIGNPKQHLHRLRQAVMSVRDLLAKRLQDSPHSVVGGGETVSLMHARWDKLYRSMYNPADDTVCYLG